MLAALEIFAAVLGGIVVVVSATTLILAAVRALLQSVQRNPACLWLANFVHRQHYQPLVRRRTWIGPWSTGPVLTFVCYFALNLSLVILPLSSVDVACSRSGVLTLINLIPLLSTWHHAAGADLFNVSLRCVRSAHRVFAAITILMAAVHVICWTQTKSAFSWSNRDNMNAILVGSNKMPYRSKDRHFANFNKASSVLALIWLTSQGVLQRRWYEVFLRCHQVLSVVVAYTTWVHTSGKSSFVNYIRISGGVSIGIFLALQLLRILWVHRFFLHGLPRAEVRVESDHVVIRLLVPFKMAIDPGQYVNIWIPGMGLRSFFQSHPFVVANFRPQKTGQVLTLMIERGKGWSHRLSRRGMSQKPYRALFTGPHGYPVPIHDYGTVIMIASCFGLVAHLPYLQHLIECHHQGTALARKVHLIWQLESIS